MGNTPVELQAFVIPEAFESLDKEYGHSSYGKEKYSSEAMFWLGYFTRYICYTREIPSRLLYRLFDIKKVYSLYTPFHTQSEEWCISRLLDQYGYTEATLDLNERLKAIMRKEYFGKATPISKQGTR